MRIGVFDSGIGGITVLNELRRRFSREEFLYFGDTANVPYGTKSEHQIGLLVTSAAARMREQNLDALVIACNTAASIAYSQFKEALPGIPLIDVVQAGVQSVTHALQSNPDGPVLILGTRATIKTHVYARLLKEKLPEVSIFEQECPLLVPLIEEGWIHHEVLSLTVEEYVRPYLALKPGVALLACTHYPWIQKAFEKLLPGWQVLDSAHAVADIMTAQLKLEPSVSLKPEGRLQWFFSDPDSVTQRIFEISRSELSIF